MKIKTDSGNKFEIEITKEEVNLIKDAVEFSRIERKNWYIKEENPQLLGDLLDTLNEL